MRGYRLSFDRQPMQIKGAGILEKAPKPESLELISPPTLLISIPS